MIRFRTIDPAGKDQQAEKPVLATPAIVTQPAPEQADDAGPKAASKGLTRKTPLRARKADAARLFRD